MSEIIYKENPAMFKSNPMGFILAVILIAAFGVGLLILAYWYLKTKATLLQISDGDVLLERGLLSKRRTELSVNQIRTVTVVQSVFNRMFGVGTIEIYTSGDDPEFVVKGMPNPDVVRDYIKNQK